MLKRTLPLAAVAFISACSAYDGMKNMEKNTAEMTQTTRDMYQATRDMKVATENLQQKTAEMSADTRAMRKATEDMVENTASMNSTTEDMARTTGSMHASTEDLKRISTGLDRKTGDLYQDNRQGLSLQLRLNALKEMNAATKQLAKIKYASFYFKSLEFQLWKDAGRDDQETLDHLRSEAVQEVIQSIDELTPKGKRSLSPLSESNAMQNLYALSATLHVLNDERSIPEIGSIDNNLGTDQNPNPSKENHHPSGILDLFYKGLGAKESARAGTVKTDEYKPYEASVLKFEEVVTYILRLRVNFLTAIAIKQLSTQDGEDANILSRIGMLLRPWEAKSEMRNTVQLQYYGWVLGEAQATRNQLLALGIDVALDPTLKKVVRNVRLTSEVKSSDPSRYRAIQILRERFTDLIQ